MLTIADLVAVIGICITCFGLGYKIGRDSKAKK